MIKLKLPQSSGIQLYDKIVENKNLERRNRLNNIRDLVAKRFQEYNDNLLALENIKRLTSLTKEEKEDLKSCYGDNIEFNRQEVIIQNMQSVAMQAVCPYCGIGEPVTLDHYLPKGLFPEFSILSINLVPCCDPCNRTKGEKWLEDGVRRIISFYTDEIPEYKYLFVKVSFENNSFIPVIEYNLDFSEENNLTNTIKMHFRDLNLFERYEKQINDKVTGLYLEVMEGASDLSIDEQKSNLKRRVFSLSKRFGSNYWEARLYEALIESNFFEKCYEQIQA
ncbi:hypothetical protein COC58_12380 [Bacillus cereus]|nr:hypothetical protein COC58_12380 [Bacillus cereus]